jgi:hypothetical protein
MVVRVLGVLLAVGVAVWATGACGGGGPKPPMQPDVDTTSLGDGGAAPEMTPPAAPAPAPSK